MARRDKGCAFPGCSRQLIDGHHIRNWIDGGETKLENLVSLCRRHHRFVHEGGASVRAHGPKMAPAAGRSVSFGGSRRKPAKRNAEDGRLRFRF